MAEKKQVTLQQYQGIRVNAAYQLKRIGPVCCQVITIHPYGPNRDKPYNNTTPYYVELSDGSRQNISREEFVEPITLHHLIERDAHHASPKTCLHLLEYRLMNDNFITGYISGATGRQYEIEGLKARIARLETRIDENIEKHTKLK